MHKKNRKKEKQKEKRLLSNSWGLPPFSHLDLSYYWFSTYNICYYDHAHAQAHIKKAILAAPLLSLLAKKKKEKKKLLSVE